MISCNSILIQKISIFCDISLKRKSDVLDLGVTFNKKSHLYLVNGSYYTDPQKKCVMRGRPD